MPKPIIHIIDDDSEADTCRKYVLPKLKDESNWTDEQIMEQRLFTAGKIIVIGRIGRRKKAKKADYLLRYSQNFLLVCHNLSESRQSGMKESQQFRRRRNIAGYRNFKVFYLSG